MAEAARVRKRLIRVFFNTFYDDAAQGVAKRLEAYGRVVKLTRSQIVPELYFVELEPRGEVDLNKLAEEIEGQLKRDDRVFGVKVYPVQT